MVYVLLKSDVAFVFRKRVQIGPFLLILEILNFPIMHLTFDISKWH